MLRSSDSAVVDFYLDGEKFRQKVVMRYKERYDVAVLLTPTGLVPVLEAQRAADAGATVRTFDRMEAQLTGLGFLIKPIEPDVQAVSRGKPTHWSWEVVPEDPGAHKLHLQLYARIPVQGSDTPLAVRTDERDIDVDITVPQRVSGFVAKHLEWLWAVLLVPLAGYSWKLIRYFWDRRHGRRPAPPAPARPPTAASSAAHAVGAPAHAEP
ncbi:MAG TPA: hypothetical protein VFT22_03130 [Kofleriaceae bacterium]|nr:hypothetical protein [Kofleriaceae bacterium]